MASLLASMLAGAFVGLLVLIGLPLLMQRWYLILLGVTAVCSFVWGIVKAVREERAKDLEERAPWNGHP